MRVLVTGGAGFIGSHIVERLIARGHAVTVLDSLSTGRLENVHPAASFVQADITDPHLPRTLAGESFDAVIHQAAQVSVMRSIDDPMFDAQVNFVGTLRLLEHCCRTDVKHFVFASSAAIYGNPRVIPVAEDAPTQPLSPYAMSKLAAEEYLRKRVCRSDLKIVILRYANVYGPRQSARGEAGVVCAFMRQTLAGQATLIHGDGRQTRDFVYVDDVAEANLLALKSDAPSGVYNVGTGQSTSILELHHLLVGTASPRRHIPPRLGDVRHSALDNTAIQSALGWRPSVSLVDGLAHTWRHFFGKPRSASLRPPLFTPPASALPAYEPGSCWETRRTASGSLTGTAA